MVQLTELLHPCSIRPNASYMYDPRTLEGTFQVSKVTKHLMNNERASMHKFQASDYVEAQIALYERLDMKEPKAFWKDVKTALTWNVEMQEIVGL